MYGKQEDGIIRVASAESSREMQNKLRALFSKDGETAFSWCALDGEEACRLIRERRPDTVLLFFPKEQAPGPFGCAEAVSDLCLEQMIAAILKELGISQRLKGYFCLKDAIALSVRDMRVINAITKTIYPLIGERYGIRKECVERNIRHAIRRGWEEAEPERELEYFGYTRNTGKKPANSEFIAAVADYIRMDLNQL